MANSIYALLGIVSLMVIMPIAGAQEFEKATFQESATILYDQKFSKSIIASVGFETTNDNEIRISESVIDKLSENKKIRAIVFTNAGECVIGITSQQQCIMINFDYLELKGDGGIRMVQDSAREMGNELINDLNELFRTDAEFHSTFIHTVDDTNALLETSGAISGRGAVTATFVTDKKATDFLFSDLAGVLVPREIRDSGGFYDVAKNLSKNDESIITITIIPNEDSNLYIFKVAQEIRDENIDVAKVNPLEYLEVSEITRSKYFDNRMVPLNSVIHLIIIPNETSKINSISTHAITDLTKLENILQKGWFLSSPAGEALDLRFLFGQSESVSADELMVETVPWEKDDEMTLLSVEEIKGQDQVNNEIGKDGINQQDDQSQYLILILIIAAGIGAAIFYLKGYKPKR